MKTILFLLAFVPATAFSQYSVMNFWGPYSAENWETFGEVSFTNSQLELLVTIFETQGGGNGGNGGNGGDELPSEEVVAEASVVLAHTGTLHLDPQWSIFTPECLEKVMF
jgi:hypothetical protein